MSAARKDKAKTSFEASLHRLEEIVEQLEQGDVSLDDSLKMYEEGVVLSKACLKKLGEVELKLKRLGKNAEGSFELFDQELE